MSVSVDLARLLDVAAGFGTVPMLLTTDEDARPRAAATVVHWDGVRATVRAGRHSLGNAARRPLVSLLWPAPPGERFALLVDARVVSTAVGADPGDGGTVTLEATRAILHVVEREEPPAPAPGERSELS